MDVGVAMASFLWSSVGRIEGDNCASCASPSAPSNGGFFCLFFFLVMLRRDTQGAAARGRVISQGQGLRMSRRKHTKKQGEVQNPNSASQSGVPKFRAARLKSHSFPKYSVQATASRSAPWEGTTVNGQGA